MSDGKQFYRCQLCNGVINGWDIKAGDGCTKCGALKMSPSNLSRWEMLVQIAKHPKFWDWPADSVIAEAEFPTGNTKKWAPAKVADHD